MVRTLLPSLLLAPLLWMAPLAAATANPAVPTDQPLPSWREGSARQRILEFVAAVTTPGAPGFVAPAERIAVFDNDGTLWSEQPMYIQLAFAIDRARQLAATDPTLLENPAIAQAVAPGQDRDLSSLGMAGILELVGLTHAGLSTEAFSAVVREWFATARHPRTGRPYTEMAYLPMQELLAYLRSQGFRTYLVSAGGTAFMRVVGEELYGVPPEQVIGSRIKTHYRAKDGAVSILRLPEPELINDGPAKPLAIEALIGRRPLAAFGNSDGDVEMLEWTTAGAGPRLGVLVHHDDGEREVAYDKASPIGRLDRGLSEAPGRGWILVSMRRDWLRVFADPSGE
ncbi:HAD family phosphatase [Cyanobium sp. NIES-981]|uniref:HAD family hydrolase n=1 Tax=Cyanobium sp. NIES-981 TaxID=1851505 RepID=UPI0007DE0F0C|nr:HAD family hydrolase [Cyanobium sp. NIES-981]SBO41789.1 Nonspecific acid phosphatase [Cyanobium sp. NIES-981]